MPPGGAVITAPSTKYPAVNGLSNDTLAHPSLLHTYVRLKPMERPLRPERFGERPGIMPRSRQGPPSP